MKIEEYYNILNKYNIKYNYKLKKIRKDYEKKCSNISIKLFKKYIKMYNSIIKCLIIELINEFLKKSEMEYYIFLSGSLARETNTLYSDIDINYLVTNEENQNKIIDIEDKINYILKNILEFRGKDRIHSMVVYIPLISKKHLLSFENNKYPLSFINGVIYDQCRKNTEKLMFESYNSTRLLQDVLEYFNKFENEKSLNEWTYCFKLLTTNSNLNSYKRDEYRNDKNINYFIKALNKNIIKDNFYLKSTDLYCKNCTLNKIYKSNVLNNVYQYLAIIYRIDSRITSFNIIEFENKCDIIERKFYELFYKYLLSIQNLQLILNKMNIDLSSHSYLRLDLSTINDYYYSLCGKLNIINDLNMQKKELYEFLLIKIKEMEKKNEK